MGKKYFYLIVAIILLKSGYAQTLNLMPWPAEIKIVEGQFVVDKNLKIGVEGNPNKRFHPNLVRFIQQLSKRTTIPFDRDSVLVSPVDASMVIKISRPGIVKLGEDESYTLKIDNNKILITSQTELGAMHCLQTLLQLLERNKESFYFQQLEINDKPRFAWRGLMIDGCRHFIPVEVIKRNIDAMSMVKLNVLHWHLSEDQGFRVESKACPKLHLMGSNGEYYTQEQIKDVISYANERGIRVMPEFDIPGHATAWMVGYPELASASCSYKVEKFFGVFDPTIDPTKKETYKFFDKFFKEMSHLFPDEYMHIGGDENNGVQWNKNPNIQAFMKKNGIKSNHELQAYFNLKILEILKKNGKKMIGWDEIFQPSLPNSIVIHSWRGREAMEDAAKKGYQSILSNGYYIDLFKHASEHYLNDPLPKDSKLSPTEQSRILGGEATMWAELVNTENIDSRIWPRTAAIAERFWSPGDINDVDDMYRRLDVVNLRLEDAGIEHIKCRDVMMRRLCNGYNIEPLKVLLDASESLKGYKRHGSKPYTTEYPLSRPVDAALSDAPDVVRFRLLFNDYKKTKNKESYSQMLDLLEKWVNNQALFNSLSANNIALNEVVPLSDNLMELASITRKLLIQLNSGIKVDEIESDMLKVQINRLKSPVAEMELPLSALTLDMINLLKDGNKME
ncbi:MAG: family 20 glycosylhydrolase [Bacteroidales bacterium]|nr:family 20 glycosylhydrolase [Bacteroidales bacterium]